jgi:antitoxin HigA-1
MKIAMRRKLKPVTPGEMLAEEFLKPLGMSNYRLAKEIGVPPQRIGKPRKLLPRPDGSC